MENFTLPIAAPLSDIPVVSSTADSSSSSPSATADNVDEDACCICLSAFTSQNPATATCCKHEYHLQCILEWSKRSKACPICWQHLVLKDPSSQELRAALQTEALRRSRTASVLATFLENHHQDYGVEQDFFSNDPEFDQILRRLVASFSTAGTSISPMPGVTLLSQMTRNAVDADSSFEQRPHDSLQGAGSSENLSFSDSIKTKWLAASSRYKESISKSTRDIKEKLLAHNNSVKELSRGVKREMSAGLAGVARMIERSEHTSKRTDASHPVSPSTDVKPEFHCKGKGVTESIVAQNLERNSEQTAPGNTSSDAASRVYRKVPSQVEVPDNQGGG